MRDKLALSGQRGEKTKERAQPCPVRGQAQVLTSGGATGQLGLRSPVKKVKGNKNSGKKSQGKALRSFRKSGMTP